MSPLISASQPEFSLYVPSAPLKKPWMITIGGLSGSGKTSLAQALCRALDDAVLVDSDVVRKEMHGVAPHERLPESAYSEESHAAFIRYVRNRQAEQLKHYSIVIVTGTFLDNPSRRSQQRFAKACNADFTGLWLQAPLNTLFERVTTRSRSETASDADHKVLHRQNKQFPKRRKPAEWLRIDAERPIEDVAIAALCALGEDRIRRDALRASAVMHKTRKNTAPPAPKLK